MSNLYAITTSLGPGTLLAVGATEAVVVAQLNDRPLPAPEIRGSNPGIIKLAKRRRQGNKAVNGPV